MTKDVITREPVRHLTQVGTPHRGAVLYVGRETGRYYADLCLNQETERRAFESRQEMERAVQEHMGGVGARLSWQGVGEQLDFPF